jgi:hypothetical protein
MPFGRTLLALVVCASAIPAAELRTVKGQIVSGDLVSVNEKEMVLLNKGGEKIVTPVTDVLVLDVNPPGRIVGGVKYIEVELVDGSILRCSGLSIKGKEAELTMLLTGQKVKMPLETIANLLAEAQEPKYQKDWQERVRKKRNRDLLALVKDEVVNGLEGTLGEGDAEGKTLGFTLAGSSTRTQVALERIHGLIFWRQQNPFLAPTVFKLIDSYQNAVLVSAVATTDSGLTVTTPSGVKLDYTFQQLSKLDYTQGKLTFLSDMTPIRLVKDDRDKEGIVFFEKDRTTYEGRFVPIRMNNKPYAKGLFIQAATEVEYDLGGDYREFKAVVGIDDYDTRGEDCPTLLVIEGDGKELLKLIVNPKDTERARAVTLNVKDVQKLKILVKSGGGLSTIARQVTLADAKVTKGTP